MSERIAGVGSELWNRAIQVPRDTVQRGGYAHRQLGSGGGIRVGGGRRRWPGGRSAGRTEADRARGQGTRCQHGQCGRREPSFYHVIPLVDVTFSGTDAPVGPPVGVLATREFCTYSRCPQFLVKISSQAWPGRL